jgi:1-acyl-sn-glycerol-3-phosphate acyltransferase
MTRTGRIERKFGRRGRFWYALAWLVLKATGWRAVGEDRIPVEPKAVGIFAHHTSAWDVVYAMALSCIVRRQANFLVKQQAVKGPLGWLLLHFGAVPVDRSRNMGLVEQAVEAIRKSDAMYLCVSPEGTRHKTDYWRTGFYHIAVQAGTPITLLYADYAKKEAGIGITIYPTGNIEADFAKIRAFYDTVTPRYPELRGEIRPKPEAQSGAA